MRRLMTIMTMLTMTAALLGVGAVGCGNSTDDEGDSGPVQTDVTIPQGDHHAFKLEGMFSETISGQDPLVTARNGKTTFNFSGIGDGDVTSIRFVIEGEAGTTGTVETVQTAQLTRKSSQFTNTEPLRVTLETYSDAQVVGTFAGEFTQEAGRNGGKSDLDEPIQVEGRFDFEESN